MENVCLRENTNGEVELDPLSISPEKNATKQRRVTIRLSEYLFSQLMKRTVASNKNASLVLREALIRELFASDY